MTVCKGSSTRSNPCQGSISHVVQMQPDAEKAVVVDGLEKIALMAVCIFVVRMWSLQRLKAMAATYETSRWVEGWLRSCKSRGWRQHFCLWKPLQQAFRCCCRLMSRIECNIFTWSGCSTCQQRYRALQVEVIAAKTPNINSRSTDS